MTKPTMTAAKAIMTYFDDSENGSPKPSVQEVKALSKEDRGELAQLIAIELGVETVKSS